MAAQRLSLGIVILASDQMAGTGATPRGVGRAHAHSECPDGIVLVDDGSTDGPIKLMFVLSESDPFGAFVEHLPARGLAAATGR